MVVNLLSSQPCPDLAWRSSLRRKAPGEMKTVSTKYRIIGK